MKYFFLIIKIIEFNSAYESMILFDTIWNTKKIIIKECQLFFKK